MRVAMAIGGLDPGSGAGVVADVRAMRAAGAWGCAVCATLTVQSSRGLVRAVPVDPQLVQAQAEELLSSMSVRALKTGALGSERNVAVIAGIAERHPRVPLVVDPVLHASAGRDALNPPPAALRPLIERATLLTPNVVEAEALLGWRIASEDDAREAARALLALGPTAVLLKGGHLPGPWVNDWLASAAGVHRVRRRRLRCGERVHGTGCALASLVAGRLAARTGRAAPDHDELVEIARWATTKLAAWLRAPRRVGPGAPVLGGP